MNCGNKFCIYQNEGKCMLNRVDIDSLGMCADCIYPDIDEKVLNQAKLELLREYQKAEHD